MNEVKSKTKRRVGCLLLSLTPIALPLLVGSPKGQTFYRDSRMF